MIDRIRRITGAIMICIGSILYSCGIRLTMAGRHEIHGVFQRRARRNVVRPSETPGDHGI